MDTTITKPLAEATPVEIDTRLADLMGQAFEASSSVARAADTIYWYAEGKRTRRNRQGQEVRPSYSLEEAISKAVEVSPTYEHRQIEAAVERLHQARKTLAQVRSEIEPLDAEFDRRGGWTRAFLAVTSGGGHVHKSRFCSTCFDDRYDYVTGEFRPGTRFAWMTEYSGFDEDTIVADAGERACTVCYPSAPVEVLSRPTKMFSEDEKAAQQAREEREAKRAAKEAAQVTLHVYGTRGYDGPVALREVTWKTLRALQNDAGALVREMAGAYAMVNGFNLDLYRRNPEGQGLVDANVEEAFHNLHVMVAALKERGVDTEALLDKNVKRARKEGNRQPVKVEGRYWDGTL